MLESRATHREPLDSTGAIKSGAIEWHKIWTLNSARCRSIQSLCRGRESERERARERERASETEQERVRK